ncbi:helix-turn-helix domain-containing protein [Streptomyces sp. NBC_01304]|uniref:helix-turn-helix domain-containing protein n=1 Tax=Streptomyces sp. NBC_01304 TaxID=2903818 RepID=UPI002E166024|nr:helix-turn-helix domain-containing protein [Streptomyces sp. NBC_01304]
MTVDDSVDEPGWDVDPEDEISAVVEYTGHLLKRRRETVGMSVPQFAHAAGYSEDQIRKIERGARIPRTEFLDKADEVLRAGGFISAMKPEMEQARYPKKVRDLAKLEEQATQLESYGNHNLHGLLQTREYAKALFELRQPALSEDKVEREVAGRLARHSIFERDPAPALSFVLEEVTLRRPIGSTMVMQRQLEHLLEVAQLRNVTIQVMPTAHGGHAGMDGKIQVLRFRDGTAVGQSEGAFASRLVSDPKELQILELRYGMIRAQALTPRESLAFTEQVLGET